MHWHITVCDPAVHLTVTTLSRARSQRRISPWGMISSWCRTAAKTSSTARCTAAVRGAAAWQERWDPVWGTSVEDYRWVIKAPRRKTSSATIWNSSTECQYLHTTCQAKGLAISHNLTIYNVPGRHLLVPGYLPVGWHRPRYWRVWHVCHEVGGTAVPPNPHLRPDRGVQHGFRVGCHHVLPRALPAGHNRCAASHFQEAPEQVSFAFSRSVSLSSAFPHYSVFTSLLPSFPNSE